MSNQKFRQGRNVKDTTAWCEKCIREAIRCIEHLPADYYMDNETDEEDEDQDQTKWWYSDSW